MDTIEMTTASRQARFVMPSFNFSHIGNLTDHTGIIQHAIYDIPNRKEGYCIDDNSRALLLMVRALKYPGMETARHLLPVYLGFMHYMQSDSGTFRNFMCYDRACPEEWGSEDSYGRSIMALGYLARACNPGSVKQAGKEIFWKALPFCKKLHSLRGMANSLIGLSHYLKHEPAAGEVRELVFHLAARIAEEYRRNREDGWHWYEPILAYDNAIIPLALLHAFEITNVQEYFQVAVESMRFLESKVFLGSHIRPIGNEGWLPKGGEPARFDQQGIDAMAMVLYYEQAYALTQEKSQLVRLHTSYQWFLGRNDTGLSLYDHATGGCADGLQEFGINRNQGAESTLAFWIAHMAATDTLKK